MPKLVIKSGGSSRELALVKENFCIGRTPENDLEVKDALISRRHSSIVKKGDRYVVYDLGSSNGTFVNNEKIEMKVLDDGDVIRIGDTEITYNDEKNTHAKPRPATLPNPATQQPPQTKQAGGIAAMGPAAPIVQHVDDIAESYAFDISNALNQGLSLRDIRKEVVGDKAAKESKMFFILFQVGKALTAAPTLDGLLDISMKLIFEVINAGRGSLFLLNDQGDLVPRLGYDKTKGKLAEQDIHASMTILNQVINERVSIITSDALQDPRFMQGLSIVQYNIRSALAVPLWEGNKVYGAVYLDNVARTYAFTRDDLDLLTAIANLIAIRIKQEELNEKLRKEEMLRSNLSKYHSPDVVEMLVKGGKDIGLEVSEREVSVLFVDVEGSTKLAEGLGPKATAELLNEFFEMVTKEIFDHKGSVNKFIGDEVMAIYNAPLDLGDHASRAVETAVEVVRKIQAHNKANPTKQFNVHVGINTGPVVAGNVGTHTRMEYTVLGDTVNVCARLCKALPANRITIGEKTYEKIKGKLPYNFKDLGDTMIRGRERSMRAYEVTA